MTRGTLLEKRRPQDMLTQRLALIALTLASLRSELSRADTRECEIGYAIVPEFQGRGVATEGMRAFLSWAFAHPNVKAAVAQTFPTLPASIRVMEKLGMTPSGAGREPGTILYRLNR